MHAYRFRVTSDDNDDFLREAEVLANQTFEDFHKLLVSSCKFEGNELASFYLCDNQWRKRREITLMDMSDDNGREQDDAPLIMKDAKLNQVINDPHQRFIYVYDFLKMFTLYVELEKIQAADLTQVFPRIIKEVSDIVTPQNNRTALVDEEEVFDEDDLREQTAAAEDEEGEDDFMSEEEGFYEDDSSI